MNLKPLVENNKIIIILWKLDQMELVCARQVCLKKKDQNTWIVIPIYTNFFSPYRFCKRLTKQGCS